MERAFTAKCAGRKCIFFMRPFWLGLDFSGEKRSLGELTIDLPVAPSKDHRGRIELPRSHQRNATDGDRLPSDLVQSADLAPAAQRHDRDRVPEHKTDFETELAVVIGRVAKNVSAEGALEHVFGYTVAEDISDRDLQKSRETIFAAANLSTPIRRWDLLFTRTSIPVISKFRCGRMARSGSRRAPAR